MRTRVQSQGAIVNFRKYDFPGWVVTVDGEKIHHFVGNPYGQISFFAPSGSHEIFFAFKETGRNLFLDILSFISLLIFFYLFFRSRNEEIS